MDNHVKSDYAKFDQFDYTAHGVGVVIQGNKVTIEDQYTESHSDDECEVDFTLNSINQVKLMLTYSNNTFKLLLNNK